MAELQISFFYVKVSPIVNPFSMLKALILAIITFLFNAIFIFTFSYFLLLSSFFTADVYEDKPSDLVYNISGEVFEMIPWIPDDISKEDFQAVIYKNLNLSAIDDFAMQPDPLFGQPILSRGFMWTVFWMLFAIEALLLLVGSLVLHKPWHRWVRWIGKVLVSGALTVSVMYLVVYFGGEWVVSRMAEGDAMVGEIVGGLYKGVAETAFIYAGIVLTIGLLLYGWATYGKRNDF